MIYLFLLILVVLDQYTKSYARIQLKGKSRKRLGPLKLAYVENRGGAMGFLKKHPRILAFLHTGTLILVLSLYLYEKKAFTGKAFGYLLIFTGGLGNLIDRIKRGYVIDFYSFPYLRLPYFNLADLYVFIGLILILLYP